MSGKSQDYDEKNDDSQNYDDDNEEQEQAQEQEYDSQDDNSQGNGDNEVDDEEVEEDNDDGNDNDCTNVNDNDDADDDDDDDDDNADGPKYIRLRGLPWSATHKEILGFLKNMHVVGGADGIHIVTRRSDGVNSGEAYVELKSQQDALAAMKLDNATMGHRYIEVFNASPREAKDAMRKNRIRGQSFVVKLRGLPFSITEQQVEDFFHGLEIKPDREGIVFVMDRRGRTTGAAFVQFESQEDTEQALGRNRQKIGHRYIEIFRSSLAELKRSTSNNDRMAPYDLRDRGGNDSDYGGSYRNNRWGMNGGFGVGANNTLGFNNLPNFGNSGNFGNNGGDNFGNFGSSNGGGGGNGMGNYGNFGNNSGANFGNFGNSNGANNFGNNSGGGGNGNGNGGGFNRFSGNSGNFGNDFEDFGTFGNNRGNNNGMGGGGNNSNGGGGFNNFSNFGNCGGSNMGRGGGFGNNMGGMMGASDGGGGNFGPIGGARNDDLYIIMMRGLPFSSVENDVFKFFEPLRPANVRIHYNKQNGRHNGTAEALFDTYDDAQVAMKRHRCKMGARYIELFFDGKAKSGKGGNNFSSGGNMGNGKSIGVGGGMGGGVFSRRI